MLKLTCTLNLGLSSLFCENILEMSLSDYLILQKAEKKGENTVKLGKRGKCECVSRKELDKTQNELNRTITRHQE